MKILFVCEEYYPETYGGGQVSNRLTINELKKKHSVEIFSISNKIKSKNDIVDGIPIRYRKKLPVPKKTPYFIKFRTDTYGMKGELKKHIKNFNPDIIHSFGIPSTFLTSKIINYKEKIIFISHLRGKLGKCYRALRRDNVCDICDFSCVDPIRRNILSILYKKPIINSLKKSNKVLTNSNFMRDIYIAEGLNNVISIYNPMTFNEKPLFDPEKKEGILFAGRMVQRKGINELIEGYVKYKKMGGKHKLYVTGENGGKIPGLEFIGYLKHDDLLKRMKKSYVVIVPSRFQEPFGRVVAEAQSLGTLVIGSGTGGMGEIMPYSIFTEVKAKKIAEALKKAELLSKEKYKDITKKGYNFIKKTCNSNHIAEQIENVYNKEANENN